MIAFDSLYNDFEIIIAHFFYPNNKNLEEIQLIIISTRMANLVQQTMNITKDWAMMIKKKELLQQTLRS